MTDEELFKSEKASVTVNILLEAMVSISPPVLEALLKTISTTETRLREESEVPFIQTPVVDRIQRELRYLSEIKAYLQSDSNNT